MAAKGSGTHFIFDRDSWSTPVELRQLFVELSKTCISFAAADQLDPELHVMYNSLQL